MIDAQFEVIDYDSFTIQDRLAPCSPEVGAERVRAATSRLLGEGVPVASVAAPADGSDGSDGYSVHLDDKRLHLSLHFHRHMAVVSVEARAGGSVTPDRVHTLLESFLKVAEEVTGGRFPMWEQLEQWHRQAKSRADEEGIPEDHDWFTSVVAGCRQRIARTLEAAAPGCLRIHVSYREAGSVQEVSAVADVTGEGQRELNPVPPVVAQKFSTIRKAYFEEGKPLWFTATSTVPLLPARRAGERGVIAFDVEHEPVWSTPVPASVYAEDLQKYPRPVESLPAWLQEKLAAEGR